jgi:hypothetical protein
MLTRLYSIIPEIYCCKKEAPSGFGSRRRVFDGSAIGAAGGIKRQLEYFNGYITLFQLYFDHRLIVVKRLIRRDLPC